MIDETPELGATKKFYLFKALDSQGPGKGVLLVESAYGSVTPVVADSLLVGKHSIVALRGTEVVVEFNPRLRWGFYDRGLFQAQDIPVALVPKMQEELIREGINETSFGYH